ncbi:MAG: hypothetical protein J5I93_11660, partial [Pirellulaceae bacterium]|nr:hypothetical protein [Pirellulaceae bacterium]
AELRVTKGSGVLPNDSGQVWREYDIQPYTSKVTSTETPQQAIVDWILRETGTEVWFSPPLGLLSATRDKLTVYHTPEMQQIVAGLVARFVQNTTDTYVLSLRLVTVSNPGWRSLAYQLMRPVDVQSPGMDAWLLSKENAAVLLAQLRQRTDFQEHNSPRVLIQNGQTQTISRLRPRTYARNVVPREGAWPSFDLQMGQVQEGYTLELSPLLSTDSRVVDAVIKCHIDQIERLVPVAVDVPAAVGGTQRIQVQVPQVASWRLHERFRWPAEHVLLLGCGVVAAPGPERPTTLGIPNPFALGPARADALLFIECQGKASQALAPNVPPTAAGNAAVPQYRGRY